MPIRPTQPNWLKKTVASIQESLITGDTSQLDKDLEKEMPKKVSPEEIEQLFSTISRGQERPPRKFEASVEKATPEVNRILMENLLEINKGDLIGIVQKHPEFLVDTLKAMVEEDVYEVLKTFGDYNIEDEKDRVEVAKACLREDARETLSSIGSFNLSEHSILEVVKDAADVDGEAVSEVIGELGIEKEADRFEIAKRAARENGPATLLNLKNYEISNAFEIMKVAAKHDGKGVAKMVPQFPDLNLDHRIELAKLCSTQNGSGTAKFIGNFGIEDAEALDQIYQIAKKENPYLKWSDFQRS